ncbi:hypothetical protein [Natrinema sp. DC36]|uniref:hypothetical protein n=1 Tax=Natrinema sp. DC36 TaxID=2878680 RepID=UPI001CF02483|nr:hypothetical protein [Natrinema sp. DC36]
MNDDTVMSSPDATVSIDVSDLPPEQALAIAREGDIENQDPYVVGEVMCGNESAVSELYDVEFHLPLGVALTVLSNAGVIDLPQEPPQEAPPEPAE